MRFLSALVLSRTVPNAFKQQEMALIARNRTFAKIPTQNGVHRKLPVSVLLWGHYREVGFRECRIADWGQRGCDEWQ